nr:protein of unknown function (DUF2649) [uncultured bacterium]
MRTRLLKKEEGEKECDLSSVKFNSAQTEFFSFVVEVFRLTLLLSSWYFVWR